MSRSILYFLLAPDTALQAHSNPVREAGRGTPTAAEALATR